AAEIAGRAVAIDTRVDGWRAVTEVTVYAADRPGLFARLAGAFAAAGANIVDARIFTLANGMALDGFSIQDADGGAFDRPDRLVRLAAGIERTLAADGPPPEPDRRPPPIPSRLSVFSVAPRVLIDNGASATHTVVEVNGRDRKGLLYDLTRALTGLKLSISTAKISTYGARAVDVFYVKDQFGLKIEDETRLTAIRAGLMQALEAPAAEPETRAARRPGRVTEPAPAAGTAAAS
ncbi:MAG TPA: ACT domain-containing protein, partial [Dongiaceae bacterium]|nr:ACT domain-containing protein [Dongiaceae bacterium]